jgi:hypothetical protein
MRSAMEKEILTSEDYAEEHLKIYNKVLQSTGE